MDHAHVCGRPGTEVGVPWEGCCDAESKPAPSPAARVRHPEKLGVRLGGVEGLAKVDCAVRIGCVDSAYAEDIKRTYEFRNLAHIEAEAEKQIEVEIEHAKNG